MAAVTPAPLPEVNPPARPAPASQASSPVAAATPAIAPHTNPASLPVASASVVIDGPPASDTALFAPPPPPSAETKPAPSQNVTINLINRLVERGILTKEDSAELIKQAEQDAETARKQALYDAAVAARAASPEPPSDDSVRVTYIPEVVKNQMRDQIKQEVMEEAKAENWAAPNNVPSWVSRFRFFGDVRVRYEGDIYPTGNANTGQFPNFNAINTGSPFQLNGGSYPPEYNVDQNRNRFRLRARFGTEIDLQNGFSAGIRLATGNDNQPVTENQTLGGANSAQGGDFSKYALWLDRGFIKYEVGGKPNDNFSITIGRFDNPFFATSIIWAKDLGFDGIVLKGKHEIHPGVTPFMTAGAFPIFNTDFNFATTSPGKYKSEDKYLYAVQGGVDWKITHDFSAKLALAYYDFENVEGQLSDPFIPNVSTDQANTDDTRPAFAQNGNTYFALRNIPVQFVESSAGSGLTAVPQYQYYGLATAFREVAVTGKLDYSKYDPFHTSLTAEWISNIAFDRNSVINNAPVNNLDQNTGIYAGGNNAWIVDFKIGSEALEKRWDWNLGLNYRYVESDSLVDGFADADFGAPLTGTNLKGYSVYGSLALAPNVWLSLSLMSANSIAGPPYKNDIIQLDVNTKF
jgi:hypothetical protein